MALGLAPPTMGNTSEETDTVIWVLMEPGNTPARNEEHAQRVVNDWTAYLSGQSDVPETFSGLEGVAGKNPKRVEFLLTDKVRSQVRPEKFQADSVRLRLNRYLVFKFPDKVPEQAVLSFVRSQPFVTAASTLPQFSAIPNDPLVGGPGGFEAFESYQWGLHALYLPDAWDWTRGGSLVAVLDTGVPTSPYHEDHRAFIGSSYVGGNVVPSLAYDFGDDDGNVNEITSVPASQLECLNFGVYTPDAAGHGTHVAGIIGATADNNKGGAGACPECKLYIAKVTSIECRGSPSQPSNEPSTSATINALTMSADAGMQVVNMSFGLRGSINHCESSFWLANDGGPYCDALSNLYDRGAVVVASSGNNKTDIDFPARDPRTVAVGGVGLDPYLGFWDEADDDDDGDGQPDGCPMPPGNAECGSNWSMTAGWDQELVAPATHVISTFYPGKSWNQVVDCADIQDDGDPSYDSWPGYGYCTGTSMAAPHVSGLFGVLRAMNPLLPAGDPADSSVYGIRDVVAETTREAQTSSGWDAKLGYGLPDAYAAVRKLLGTIGGVRPNYRIKPLFGVYAPIATDHAYTTSPQGMIAFSVTTTGDYDQAVGDPVPEYPEFPHETGLSVVPPRAVMYVLSTNWPSPAGYPDLVPIYRMATPAGQDRDFLLATSAAEIETFAGMGYELERLEGYIFGPCGPGETCPPPGTEAVHRVYSPGRNDTAIVLQRDLAFYQSMSGGYYVGSMPQSTSTLIGYAYSTDDGDSDGLPDGYETLVGLDPNDDNTDDDCKSDGWEYPIAFVPRSDPDKYADRTGCF